MIFFLRSIYACLTLLCLVLVTRQHVYGFLESSHQVAGRPRLEMKKGASLFSSTKGKFKSSVSFLTASHGEDNQSMDKLKSRRSLLKDTALIACTAHPLLTSGQVASADDTETIKKAKTIDIPDVTHRVFMNVRISRPDGTFYVRDDETPENRVFTGRLEIGLFGKAAPVHTEQFLSYIRTNYDDIDRPFPNYGRSNFASFNAQTGVIVGGMIPSLEITEFAGSTAIQYGGRILPAPLWIEKRSRDDDSQQSATQQQLPLPSSSKALLIHRTLDVTPSFGITTRSDSTMTELDNTHVAFGTILLDESSKEFLQICESLPTYTLERSKDYDNDGPVQEAAKSVYDAQKQFFRGAAKTFGDTRLAKVYPGKFLRRVEVTQVGIL